MNRRPCRWPNQEERPTQINFAEPINKNKETEKTRTASNNEIPMKMQPLRRSLRILERTGTSNQATNNQEVTTSNRFEGLIDQCTELNHEETELGSEQVVIVSEKIDENQSRQVINIYSKKLDFNDMSLFKEGPNFCTR